MDPSSALSSARSTEGCLTCRARRKKCDQVVDNNSCGECTRLNIQCLGFRAERFEWMRDPDMLKSFTDEIKGWTSKRSNLSAPSRLSFGHYFSHSYSASSGEPPLSHTHDFTQVQGNAPPDLAPSHSRNYHDPSTYPQYTTNQTSNIQYSQYPTQYPTQYPAQFPQYAQSNPPYASSGAIYYQQVPPQQVVQTGAYAPQAPVTPPTSTNPQWAAQHQESTEYPTADINAQQPQYHSHEGNSGTP